jgi:WD40 repeat protein
MGHGSRVAALAVLPDGRLASGAWYQTIRLWDESTGAETARLDGHEDGVRALAVLPDGRLASGELDGTIRLWDVSTGAETARLEGHERAVTALAVLPDGRLASGSADGKIRLRNAATGTETARLDLDSAVWSLCWLPQARLLVAGDRRGRLHWLETDLTCVTQSPRNMYHSFPPTGRE